MTPIPRNDADRPAGNPSRQLLRFPRVIAALLVLALGAMCVAASSASAESGVYENANEITIPDQGRASAYPSTIDVQGLPGRITDVTVTLRGLSHTRPADLDILLVSPDGDDSFVMSDACGTGFENYSSSSPRTPPRSCRTARVHRATR